MEAKTTAEIATNPLLIQRSRNIRVEDACDALRGLSRDAFAYLDVKGAQQGPEYTTYHDVMEVVESVLKLAGRRPEVANRMATWANIAAADSSMRLESRLAGVSDDTLKTLEWFCHNMERTLATSRTRRAVVLNAIPERIRQSRVIGHDLFEFLGWKDDVAEEAEGIIGALWGRLLNESRRRAERAESAA